MCLCDLISARLVGRTEYHAQQTLWRDDAHATSLQSGYVRWEVGPLVFLDEEHPLMNADFVGNPTMIGRISAEALARVGAAAAQGRTVAERIGRRQVVLLRIPMGLADLFNLNRAECDSIVTPGAYAALCGIIPDPGAAEQDARLDDAEASGEELQLADLDGDEREGEGGPTGALFFLPKVVY